MTATTAILVEAGYDGATTTAISERAGVSRGAIQKQFAQREDIFIAVIAHLAALIDNRRLNALRGVADPLQRWMALADFTWHDVLDPTSIAFVEIQMASRRDARLRSVIQPHADALRERRLVKLYELAVEVGITDRTAIRALVWHDLAAINGLAMEAAFTGNAEAAYDAFLQLRANCLRTLTELLGADLESELTPNSG